MAYEDNILYENESHAAMLIIILRSTKMVTFFCPSRDEKRARTIEAKNVLQTRLGDYHI